MVLVLYQAVQDNKAKVEALFAGLETVTNEHDAKAKGFDQRLSTLAEIS